MKILLTNLCCLFVLMMAAHAQTGPKIKFGKISVSDLSPTVYSLDSNASAVVLADVGSSAFEGNEKGSFKLIFKRLTRIHILNKNGYDAGEFHIPIYTDGDMEEKITNLKAVTYNLEGTKVVETKLDKEEIFKDRINKHLVIKKFTMPNLRAGSIIEVEYKMESDFIFNLQPWAFQGGYPTLWSEYTVSMPQFYYYVTLTQGYQPYFLKETKDHIDRFTFREEGASLGTDRGATSFSAGVTDFRFAMKDVPGLHEESYTSTISNHLSRIEFQLAELRQPFEPKKVMDSWETVSARLLEQEDFGLPLKLDNLWMNDYVDEAIAGKTGDLEKTRGVYAYVRDQLTSTGYNARYVEKPLRVVMKTKSGTEAEINMLLVGMLRRAGIPADPVLLSTKKHGFPYAEYPMLDRFNYIICRALVDGRYYLLDASHPHLGFGSLDDDCFNGHARVIDKDATPLELNSDANIERKLTAVFLVNGKDGHFNGKLNQTMGGFESYHFRDKILGTGTDDVLTEMKSNFGSDVTYTNYTIDSLRKYDVPVSVHYDFDMALEKNADILYVNPMFSERILENPFKSAERNYPVEMPYQQEETFILRMDVPEGYQVEELPKQTKVKLNEAGDGQFEYLISVSDGVVSLRSKLTMKRSYFNPSEYEMLRNFYALVVKKHNEQIVFKKK